MIKKSAKPLTQFAKLVAEMESVSSQNSRLQLDDIAVPSEEHKEGPMLPTLQGKQYKGISKGHLILKSVAPDNCINIDEKVVVFP